MATTSATTTFVTVQNNVFERLGQNTTSLQFPITMVRRFIVEGLRFMEREHPNPRLRRGSYSFNKAKDLSVTTYSATQINTGTHSTYTPATGKVMLKYSEIVDYAGKTSTAFTTLTGLGIVFTAGDNVSIGYALDSDVREVEEVLFNGVPLTFVDKAEYSSKNSRNVYTIIDDYLFLPYSQINTDVITVNYIKKLTVPTTATSADDAVVLMFDDEYISVLELFATMSCYREREDDRFELAEKAYLNEYRKYKAFLSKQHRGTKNVIPTYGFGSFRRIQNSK